MLFQTLLVLKVGHKVIDRRNYLSVPILVYSTGAITQGEQIVYLFLYAYLPVASLIMYCTWSNLMKSLDMRKSGNSSTDRLEAIIPSTQQFLIHFTVIS